MAVTKIRDAQAVQSIDLTSEVSGNLPITNGGTGAATLPSGLLKGAGTGAITAATSGIGGDYATMADLAAKNVDPLTSSYATFPRALVLSTQSGLVSGTLYLVYFIADSSSKVISNLNVICVGAATATVTKSRLGLYSVNTGNGNMTLVASAANNNAAFTTGGSNVVTMALSSPSTYTPTYGSTYAMALICITSGTMPTFQGPSISGSISLLTPRLMEAQGVQTDLPSTLTAAYNAGTQGKPIFMWSS